MTRVIHTGDTHVGYRQYHRPERRQDFLDAFRSVITDAIDQDVDAVVHAGDLFHDRRPGLSDLRGTIEILERLRNADIPFLAIVGNHEDSRDGQWIDLFEQLDLATHLDREGDVVGNTTFYGLDYVPRAKRDQLTYEFEPASTEYAALVGHGLFTPFPHGDWDLEEVLSTATVDIDAALLGDDHTPDRKQVNGAWATYCGSTERTSASQRVARGYNVLRFEDSVSITRRDIDTRPFVFIDVELAESEGESIVRERIREAAVEDAVVIVTIEGDGADIHPAEIESVGDAEGALVTRVNDRRELETDTDTTVSFADPDDAVDERVRELGLSEVATKIENLVRDQAVAESNLRDHVVQTVDEQIENPSAFEPVPEEKIEAEAPESESPVGEGDDDSTTEADTEESGSEDAPKNSDTEEDSQVTTMEDFL